jgi:hypothetical protein
MTMLISKQMRVYLVEGEVILDAQRCDEGVVVRLKTGEEAGDDLILVERLAEGSKGVRQGLHLAEVVRRRHAFLLGGGELCADLNYACVAWRQTCAPR